METYKVAWLKTRGLSLDDIADCDISAETVTFSNGDTRQLTNVYSRCMGYFASVSQWNPGKQQEHRDRKYFTESANGSDDLSSFRTGIQARL